MTPRTSARSPATLEAIDVRGATVVTTWSLWPSAGAGSAFPAAEAAAGHVNGPAVAAAAADADALAPLPELAQAAATTPRSADATTAARARRDMADLNAIACSSQVEPARIGMFT